MASIEPSRDMTPEQFAEYCDRSVDLPASQEPYSPPDDVERAAWERFKSIESLGPSGRFHEFVRAYRMGRAEPHQHTCWECGAKVPRKPEDIARGNANTRAVVAAMAEGDPDPLLEMPDPYPATHTPRTT